MRFVSRRDGQDAYGSRMTIQLANELDASGAVVVGVRLARSLPGPLDAVNREFNPASPDMLLEGLVADHITSRASDSLQAPATPGR